MSTQPCGCDPEALWECQVHREISEPYRSTFTIKDSGERQQFDSGMVRDVTTGKVDYSLALDGPLFRRLAEHLTEGAQKYDKRNWMKAEGQAERDRFKESALRHFLQWFWDEKDEDHFAATAFNMNGKEFVEERMKKGG